VIRVVRLGSPRASGEGLRLGTVRRPPRGVKKSEFARRDYYDIWLPDLAPSPRLIAKAHRDWSALPAAQRLLELLARLSHGANFSVGCYCEDESRCHRSILRRLLEENGARLS